MSHNMAGDLKEPPNDQPAEPDQTVTVMRLSDPSENRELILEEIEYFFKEQLPEVIPIYIKDGEHMIELFKDHADLFFVDFGGLSYDRASCIMQSSSLRTWAENHPGSLVILWTPYTDRVYEDEIGPDMPDNMIKVWSKGRIFALEPTDEYEALANTIRRWLGIEN